MLGEAVAVGWADLTVWLWLREESGEWSVAGDHHGDPSLVPFCCTPIRTGAGALIGPSSTRSYRRTTVTTAP